MDRTTTDRTGLAPTLAASLFEDRCAQFVGRLGWDLCVSPGGLEIDQYDGDGTSYLVVHDQDRHVGSCRVRPITAGTMIMDHFSEVFPDAAGFLRGQSRRVYELTRFCRSPHASKDEAQEMLVIMAEMLDEFRDAHGLTGFVAVVYPEVARFLSSIGVRFLRLAVSEIDGRETHMICIIHCVRVERLTAQRSLAKRLLSQRFGSDDDLDDTETAQAA